MTIDPTFNESLKSDVLWSIYGLLWGVAMMLAPYYILSTSAPVGRGGLTLYLCIFGLPFVILGITGLVKTFPHYKQLTELLEKVHSKEMLLTVETKISGDGETDCYGNFDLPDRSNQKHVFSVIITSPKLKNIAPNTTVKVYYNNLHEGNGPIIVEAEKELFWPRISNWPSNEYIL